MLMKTRHQIANNELLFLFKTQPLDSSQPSILLGLSKPKETTTCMYTNVSSKPWGTFTCVWSLSGAAAVATLSVQWWFAIGCRKNIYKLQKICSHTYFGKQYDVTNYEQKCASLYHVCRGDKMCNVSQERAAFCSHFIALETADCRIFSGGQQSICAQNKNPAWPGYQSICCTSRPGPISVGTLPETESST